MHILFITHFFPPKYTSGTETYTLGIAQALRSRGHFVEVLCADDWDMGERYWNGVTEDYLGSEPAEGDPGLHIRRIHLNWAKADDPNRVLYDSDRVEKWLDDYLSHHRPDIVHVTSTYSLGVGILRCVHRAGIPLVVTLTDFWFICPQVTLMRSDGELCDGITTPWQCQRCLLAPSGLHRRTAAWLPEAIQARLWDAVSRQPTLARQPGARGMALNMVERKTIMRQVLELPDVLLSPSRFVQEVYSRTGLSARVRYFPHGHDLSWVADYRGKVAASRLRFGYMGRISETKGVHLLIEAFQKGELASHAILDVWGNLGQESAYAQRLRDLIDDGPGPVGGERPAIILRGAFQRHQLAEVLSQIDVMVVPSLWYENAPLVIQEAFATKTPVIATNLGGMAEAVTFDVNGLLFERNDATDLARQMRRVVEEPGLLMRLREGIPSVRSIADEADELAAIYRPL